MKIFTVF